MVKFLKDNKEFAFIFLAAAIIRFIPAFKYQFSYDELCGLRNSAYGNWHDLINYGVKLDTHPILVQLIINVTISVFGYTEFWVKLPFLIFSLAAIIYIYLFSLKWYGKSTALIAASIFSFSYIFLFYAPLARMYAGGLFFSTALTYYLFEICFSEIKKTKHYVLFVVFILLCALNNHLSCLYALTCAIAGLFFQNRTTVLKYVMFCVVAVLLYLPHLTITLWQLKQSGIGHEQDGWLPVPDKFVLFGFIKTLFGTGMIWIWFVVVVMTAFIIVREIPINKKTITLIILFFVNYLIIHLYSVYKAPVFQYSVMLFSAPCFIVAFMSLVKFKTKVTLFIALVSSGLLIYQSVFVKKFFTNGVLNQTGFMSEKYCELEAKYGKKNVEAYFMTTPYYFVVEQELKYKKKFNYYLGSDFGTISEFKSHLMKSEAEFILLSEPSHIELETAKEIFPFLTDAKQTLNVNYYLLSRSKQNTVGAGERVSDVSTADNPDLYGYSVNNKKLVRKRKYYLVDSTSEFCFSAYSNLRKFDLKEGNTILAKVKIKSETALKNVEFDYSVTGQDNSQLFFGGSNLSGFYTHDTSGYIAYVEMFIGSDFKKWQRDDAKFAFFIWNKNKEKFIISDFEIKTIDYWKERWSWWD